MKKQGPPTALQQLAFNKTRIVVSILIIVSICLTTFFLKAVKPGAHGTQHLDILLQSEGKLEKLKEDLENDDKLRQRMLTKEYEAKKLAMLKKDPKFHKLFLKMNGRILPLSELDKLFREDPTTSADKIKN